VRPACGHCLRGISCCTFEGRTVATVTPSEPEVLAPLRTVHTASFPALLEELGLSIRVTTYQAGIMVMLRPEGVTLSTHFGSYSKQLGLALGGDRLAVGTALEVWGYHNRVTAQ
jgi:hypothetical protein